MGFFDDAKTQQNVKQKDVVSGGYQPLESGIYQLMITQAYASVTAGGSKAVNLRFKTSDGAREVREVLYVTKKKGGNTFVNENTGETQYMMGFELADSLAEILCECHLSELEMETRIVKVYSPKEGKEVNQEVPVMVQLLDQPIYACIQKVQVNKSVKADKGYVETNEMIEKNEIVKFLRAADRKSILEIRADSDAQFYDDWNKQWAGKTRNKFKKVDGAPAAPAASGGAKSPTQSGMFK